MLPNSAGLGLKTQHFGDAISLDSAEGQNIWFEVHPENYLACGGARLDGLCELAEIYPVSFHSVSASLGGGQNVDEFLKKLKSLVDCVKPISVSDHLAWSRLDGHYFAELLPLPRTAEVFSSFVTNIDRMQNVLHKRILIENPANYLTLKGEYSELEFLFGLCQKTGCGLLLDISNLLISANNCGGDPREYIESIPSDLVGEIHVAGFEADGMLGETLLIDSHSCPVALQTWQLLEFALQKLGQKPVLVEWDGKLPEFVDLLQERMIADNIIKSLDV